MSKGGSAPDAPDYRGAAVETAAGNLENQRLATRANRMDQYNPWGARLYTDLGDDRWREDTILDPVAEQTLNKQLDLSNQYADTAQIGFDKARSSLENPQLDVSALPSRGIDVGKTAQEAILTRLAPQLAQQDEALRARLANQGITLGSDAYSQEVNAQNQKANDLQLQAAMRGIELDQANRSAALQEQAYLQDRPLNLVNALRSGAQVQAPQFQQFAQQQYTPGPDILGAVQGQYSADMNAYNAQQANSGNMLSGLLGIGASVAGLPVKGGGSLGGNFLSGLFK